VLSLLSSQSPARVLDFHVRVAPRPGATERVLAMLDECGIDQAVACAGGIVDLETLSRQIIDGSYVTSGADNDAVLAACAGSEGRLVPFFFANPHEPAERYEKQAAEFRGLEISPAVHGIPLDDPRVALLAEIAAEARHPVYVACIIRPGCGVADLSALARRHPATTFVAGHSGTGNIDFHAITVIEDQPNIMLETSGGYTTVIADALRRLGPQRVLFGSEAPLQHPAVELTKYREAGTAPADWALVSWDNAARLLGYEKEQT